MIPQYSTQAFDRNRIQIADDVLAERAARITPFILKDGHLHRFTVSDLRNVAFTWDPQGLVPVDGRTEIWAEVSRGQTMHGCGYHAFFKPSIAEVLAQLPDNPEIMGFFLRSDSVAVLSDGAGHICDVVWLTRTYVATDAEQGMLPGLAEEKA